jgi:glycosyltransferase involved in cell wall biosynthesis
MKKLSIIIPSLRKQRIDNLISNIKRVSYSNYEIIVVGEKPIYPEGIICIEDKTRDGPISASELGYQNSSGKYITVLPDDCKVLLGWDVNMISFIEQQGNNIFQGNFSLISSGDKKELPQPVYEYFGKPFAPFFIISRKSIEKVGGFLLTKYKHFYSDVDLSMRVWMNGGVVSTCWNAFIVGEVLNDSLHSKNVTRFAERDFEVFKESWKHLAGEEQDYSCHPIL